MTGRFPSSGEPCGAEHPTEAGIGPCEKPKGHPGEHGSRKHPGLASREMNTWLNEVEVYPDTHSRHPTTLDGRDAMRSLISSDLQQRAEDEEQERAKEKEDKDRDWALRRGDAERALGEFFGYKMFPEDEKEAEFRGIYLASGSNGWVFEVHVADYVFKLERTDGCPKDASEKPGDYNVYVTTSFEQKYMTDDWEWHRIERPGDIVDLERDGKVGRR